jgi:hypothetical protein
VTKEGKFKEPAVIGAVLDLGHCLNLTDYASKDILQKGYEILVLKHEMLDLPLPKNCVLDEGGYTLLRDLDCAVIQQIHMFNEEENLPSFDSVRGVFTEGKPAYPGAGFREKTHIQICIRNPNCIKGYFCPRELHIEYCNP